MSLAPQKPSNFATFQLERQASKKLRGLLDLERREKVTKTTDSMPTSLNPESLEPIVVGNSIADSVGYCQYFADYEVEFGGSSDQAMASSATESYLDYLECCCYY